MRQTDTEKKLKNKASKFIKRATYSLGEWRKRTDRVRPSETKAIAQAYRELGGRIKPVAMIFKRDPRTISSALAKVALDSVVAGWKQLSESQRNSERLEDLAKFLSQWKSELPLPLNCLDNEDLSRRGAAAPLGGTIRWDYYPSGTVIRRFSIEDSSKFKLMKKHTLHSKLWRHFDDYKHLNGNIIAACSALAEDIKQRSERETGLSIVSTDQWGLDQFFAWTVYADALHIFAGDWGDNIYHCVGERDGLCHLRWGDYTLAVINLDAKDTVASAHQQLRLYYRNCRQVKHILGLTEQLRKQEARIRDELDTILQGLTVGIERSTHRLM